MELNEVDEFLPNLGVTLSSDKQAFRNMYNYVFDPVFKMQSFAQGNQPETDTDDDEPEIKAFLDVFRKRHRTTIFPSLAEAGKDAEIAFTKAVARKQASCQMTATELKDDFETKLRTRIQTLEKWIKEVDTCRRNKFKKAAWKDAIENFKVELYAKYPFDSIKVRFYKVADIIKFSEQLEDEVVGEFSKDINVLLKEPDDERSEQCSDLREELCQLVNDVLQKNKKIRETFVQKTKVSVAKFRETMNTFLKTHPLAKKEDVSRCCAQTKIECEEEQELSEFLASPILKSAWEQTFDVEFRAIARKAEINGKVESFLQTIKTQGQKAFKETFNIELEGGELERMFSQVGKIAKRNLEKADESPSDKDNVAIVANSSKKTSQAPIGIVLGNEYNILIPANSILPTKEYHFYATTTTSVDNVTSIPVSFYEGTSPPAATARKLGEICWNNIPSSNTGVETVDYTMQVDAFGFLIVEWKVAGSGKKQTAKFKTSSAWQGNDSPTHYESRPQRPLAPAKRKRSSSSTLDGKCRKLNRLRQRHSSKKVASGPSPRARVGQKELVELPAKKLNVQGRRLIGPTPSSSSTPTDID